MKHIYLVRHGETMHNASGLVQDSMAELSDIGRQQAQLIAHRLKDIDYHHLLVSDYVRTRQTAEYITPPDSVSIVFSDLVREQRRPSEFFNQPNTSSEFWQFLEQEEINLDNPNWHWSDEENFYDVVARVEKVYQYATSKT